MDRWRGKVAMVTGASAGIGLAIAKALLQEGMIVVGLARRKDKMLTEMNDIKTSGEFHAVKCDVTKKSDVIEAFEFIKKKLGALHVLINNAGTVKLNSIEDTDIEEMEEIVNLNLMGLLHCSKLAIKLMKQNDVEGYIVNINSVAGHMVPNIRIDGNQIHINVYAATKFAVTALSETLTNELRGNKIRVTNLSPGFVHSELTQNNADSITDSASRPALQPEDVANSVVYILGTPQHVQITELTIRPLGESL